MVPVVQGDINTIKAVQKKAVRMVAGLHGNTYEEKCKELGLDTLERRRWIQDIMQTHKIIHGQDKLSRDKLFKFRSTALYTRTAADPLHLDQSRARQDIRRKVFKHRVVDSWNGIGHKQKARGLARFRTALKSYTIVADQKSDIHRKKSTSFCTTSS